MAVIGRCAAFPAVRAAYGALLLFATSPVLRLVTGHSATPRATAVARVLGLRHLGQAAATGFQPTAVPLALGAEVDVAHSASMLAVVALSRTHRRAGAVDATVATAFAMGGALVARRLARSGAVSRTGEGTVRRLCTARDRLAMAAARWCLPAAVRRALRA